MGRKRDPQAELKADLDKRKRLGLEDPAESVVEILLKHLTESTLRLEALTVWLVRLTVVLAFLTVLLFLATLGSLWSTFYSAPLATGHKVSDRAIGIAEAYRCGRLVLHYLTGK